MTGIAFERDRYVVWAAIGKRGQEDHSYGEPNKARFLIRRIVAQHSALIVREQRLRLMQIKKAGSSHFRVL